MLANLKLVSSFFCSKGSFGFRWLYLVLAIAAGISSAYLVDVFLQCDYLVLGVMRKSEWSNGVGYTVDEFWCLASFVILFPFSILMYLAYAYQAALEPVTSRPLRFIEHTLVITALTVFCYEAAVTYSSPVLQCGILCFGDEHGSSDKNGGIIFTGLVYFFACLLMLVCPVVSIIRLLMVPLDATSIHDGSFEEQTSLLSSSTPSRPKRRSSAEQTKPSFLQAVERQQFWRKTGSSVVFLLLYPACLFCCMVFPNLWNKMSKQAIRQYEAMEILDEDYYNGQTWNFYVYEYLTLTLYADIVIYFVFIYALMAMGIAASHSFKLRMLLRRTVNNPRTFLKFLTIPSFTVGELVLLFWFKGLLLAQLLWWFYDHGWHSQEIDEKTWQERLARTLGQLGNIIVACMLLPISRSSIWTDLWGLSWEYAVSFHRYMGYLLVAVSVTHMLFWWKVYAQENDWEGSIYSIPTAYTPDNFTVPLMTLFSYMFWVTTLVFSYKAVRRAKFELFYFTHMLYLSFFLAILWHANSAWYFILPSLILWVFDHILRFFKTSRTAKITSMAVSPSDSLSSALTPSSIVTIEYSVSNGLSLLGSSSTMDYLPGQYCFLCVPAISTLCWHPFTLSSSPDEDDTFTHHIKAMPSNPKSSEKPDPSSSLTWTERLAMLAQASQNGGKSDPIMLCVDGPYGNPPPIERFSSVLLVAGGIGVTPMISHLRHFVSLHKKYLSGEATKRFTWPERMKLVWSVRSAADVLPFLSTIQQVLDHFNQDAATLANLPIAGQMHISVQIHVTKGSSKDGPVLEENGKEEDEEGRNPLYQRQGRNANQAVMNVLLPYEVIQVTHEGRPNLHAEVLETRRIATALGPDLDRGACAYVCGPSGMLEQTSIECKDLSVNCFTETFEL
jgi:NAD(P)H-flavin reductase